MNEAENLSIDLLQAHENAMEARKAAMEYEQAALKCETSRAILAKQLAKHLITEHQLGLGQHVFRLSDDVCLLIIAEKHPMLEIVEARVVNFIPYRSSLCGS